MCCTSSVGTTGSGAHDGEAVRHYEFDTKNRNVLHKHRVNGFLQACVNDIVGIS